LSSKGLEIKMIASRSAIALVVVAWAAWCSPTLAFTALSRQSLAASPLLRQTTTPTTWLPTSVQQQQQLACSRVLAATQLQATGLSEKKIIVLGGDGFCGWPTSLHLSDAGHDVVIVDNLSRRKIDLDLGCDSLTPIQSPEVRLWFLLTLVDGSIDHSDLVLSSFIGSCRGMERSER
jgi:hypothetical protein